MTTEEKRNKKILQTGVEITTDKNGKDKVFSPSLENNPLLNKKIGVTKFSSKHIPTERKGINNFFSKFNKI